MAVRIEPVAGLAVGKIIKWIWKRFGLPTYEVAGVDIVKTGVGAALAAASYYYGARLGRFDDVVGYAGAGIIVDELAHAAGINPAEVKTVVVKSKSEVKRPRTSVVIA